jgi:hypothetical protein
MNLWHQLWNNPDPNAIEKGLEEIHQTKNTDGPTTPREKVYIAAIIAFYSNAKKLTHEAVLSVFRFKRTPRGQSRAARELVPRNSAEN